METAAAEAANALAAAESAREASEAELKSRIAALESESAAAAAAFDEERRTLESEAKSLAEKLDAAERRAARAEASASEAASIAAEHAAALEVEVATLRERTVALETTLAERDAELAAATANLTEIRAELADVRAELAAKAEALADAEREAVTLRARTAAAAAGPAKPPPAKNPDGSSAPSWLVGGAFGSDAPSFSEPLELPIAAEGLGAWASANAELTMSARLTMLIENRRELPRPRTTIRIASNSRRSSRRWRRVATTARLEASQAEVEERLRGAGNLERTGTRVTPAHSPARGGVETRLRDGERPWKRRGAS